MKQYKVVCYDKRFQFDRMRRRYVLICQMHCIVGNIIPNTVCSVVYCTLCQNYKYSILEYLLHAVCILQK